jgi:hypothetical protein
MIEDYPAITLTVVAIKPLEATIRVALKSVKDIWCRSNFTFPSGPAQELAPEKSSQNEKRFPGQLQIRLSHSLLSKFRV